MAFGRLAIVAATVGVLLVSCLATLGAMGALPVITIQRPAEAVAEPSFPAGTSLPAGTPSPAGTPATHPPADVTTPADKPTAPPTRGKRPKGGVGQGRIGVLIVDVRPPGKHVSDRVIHSLQAVRRTAPDVRCELWMSLGGPVPAPLQAYLQVWKHMVTVRYMPASYKNPHNGATINLAGVNGGHIGKALALRESSFDFPIVLDGDSFPCQGWLEEVQRAMQDADVIWSLAPVQFGATQGNNDAHTAPMSASQAAEYRKFPERNTGTVFAVRRTPATRLWLTAAIDIRANQTALFEAHRETEVYRSFSDQGAFRESFFLHRHLIREYLFPKDRACRKPKEKVSRCACGANQCLFTHSKNGFRACAKKYASASPTELGSTTGHRIIRERAGWGGQRKRKRKTGEGEMRDAHSEGRGVDVVDEEEADDKGKEEGTEEEKSAGAQVGATAAPVKAKGKMVPKGMP